MVNRRPTPDLVKARLWEIKQRYERHSKVGKRTRSLAAIRLAELTRWLHDTYGAGVELEPSRDALMIAEIFAHHIAVLANAERRISQWLAFYAPTIPPQEQERLIGNALGKPIKWSADKLGWKIKLSDEQRTRLNITSIGALGINKEQRAIIRKQKAAERAKRHRDAKRVRTI